MNSRIKLLASLVVGLAIVALTVGATSTGAVRRFEYKVLERKARHPEEILNAAGQEGWELVAVDVSSVGSERYYVKREIR